MSTNGDSTPRRQDAESWTTGEIAENGEIIATKPRDITESLEHHGEDSAGRPAGDVFGMSSTSNAPQSNDE